MCMCVRAQDFSLLAFLLAFGLLTNGTCMILFAAFYVVSLSSHRAVNAPPLDMPGSEIYTWHLVGDLFFSLSLSL